MTDEQQISELQKELKLLKTQEQNLNNWLINHLESQLMLSVVSDLNALTVKIRTTEYKISNLEKRQPLLGYEIPESISQQQNAESKKRKPI